MEPKSRPKPEVRIPDKLDFGQEEVKPDAVSEGTSNIIPTTNQYNIYYYIFISIILILIGIIVLLVNYIVWGKTLILGD